MGEGDSAATSAHDIPRCTNYGLLGASFCWRERRLTMVDYACMDR